MGKAFWIIHSILLLDLLAASSVKADGKVLSADMDIIRQLISEKKTLIIICSDLSEDIGSSLDKTVLALGKGAFVQKVSNIDGTGKEAWVVSMLSLETNQDTHSYASTGIYPFHTSDFEFKGIGEKVNLVNSSCYCYFPLPEIYFARAGIEG